MRRRCRIDCRSPLKAYGTAILLVSAAFFLRFAGRRIVGDDSPFLFFFSALALVSWYGGFFPGLVSTILGSVGAAFLFVPPISRTGSLYPDHILHHMVFLSTGALISYLMGKLHKAVERSSKAERELERRVRERTAELADANRLLTLEKDKLRGILDQMPESVYIVNPGYGIEYANPAMEREFGKVGNQKCFQYTRGPGAAVCESCRNPEVFEGKTFSTEWTVPASSKVYDCFEAPILIENGVVGKLKILHDITGIRNAEKELSTKHEQIRRLSSELLNTQEAERLRISKELHDELGQALTLIKLKIGLLETGLGTEQQRLRMLCADASGHVDTAIENMRRLSRDLSPVTVETLGITIALRRLAEEFGNSGKIRITADIDPLDGLLSLHSSILLYRIFQEGLNNIVKHSGAASASVSIKILNDGRLHFELKDDGRGLDSNAAAKGRGGFGLAIMNERVRTLGGSLEIETREHSGTRLGFAIPIKTREGHDNAPDNSGR